MPRGWSDGRTYVRYSTLHPETRVACHRCAATFAPDRVCETLCKECCANALCHHCHDFRAVYRVPNHHGWCGKCCKK